MFKIFHLLIFVFCSSFVSSSEIELYFIEPKDGATLNGPVKIVFGLTGMGVAPAGIDFPNTGHHHLLINVQAIDFYMPIPSSKNHLHFGGGQTETLIELTPGEHELQLVLGDLYHVAHSPPVTSKKIKILVK